MEAIDKLQKVSMSRIENDFIEYGDYRGEYEYETSTFFREHFTDLCELLEAETETWCDLMRERSTGEVYAVYANENLSSEKEGAYIVKVSLAKDKKIKDIAERLNLKVIDNKDSIYILNFDNFEQIKDVHKELGGEITEFRQRSGSDSWESAGEVYEPFDIYNFYGEKDDITLFTDKKTAIEVLRERAETDGDISDELLSAAENMKENDALLVYGGDDFEYEEKQSIYYYIDGVKYRIGLLINKEF